MYLLKAIVIFVMGYILFYQAVSSLTNYSSQEIFNFYSVIFAFGPMIDLINNKSE
jgi:hypothetical protein